MASAIMIFFISNNYPVISALIFHAMCVLFLTLILFRIKFICGLNAFIQLPTFQLASRREMNGGLNCLRVLKDTPEIDAQYSRSFFYAPFSTGNFYVHLANSTGLEATDTKLNYTANAVLAQETLRTSLDSELIIHPKKRNLGSFV